MKEDNGMLWREVLENLEDAVCVVNSELETVFSNRRFAELLGEGDWRRIEELLPQLNLNDEIQSVLDSGERRRYEQSASLHGEERHFEILISPFEYEDERYAVITLRDVSKERRVREELEKLRNFSENVFDGISTGIIVLDRELKIKAMNTYQEEHMRKYGKLDISREEVIGKPFTEISTLLEEEYEGVSFRELFRRVLEKGEVVRVYNHEHRSKAGATVYLNFTIQPLRGANGEIEGLILLSEDATEKAMLEMEVKRSRDFLENVLESLGHGVVVVDREFRIIMCNRAYAEMCSLPKEEIIGRKCYEVAHHRSWPCTEERESCPVLKVFSTGEPAKMVHEHKNKEGKRFYAEVSAYPLRSTSGEVEHVLEVMSDITERYELEKKLRETGGFLENIIKSSGDAIIATDLRGSITFWSQGAEKMFGYTAEEVLGKSIYDLYPEEYREKRKRMEEFLLEYPDDAIRNYRMKIYRKDGRLIDISLSLSLLKDAKGEPIGMVGIAKDITKEVEAEEELKRKMRELEDFYNMAIGREMKMIELKNEIAKLREEIRRLRGEI